MEDDRLCYVARAEASRIMSAGLKVGSRLPLYPTAMGRMSPADIAARILPALRRTAAMLCD